MPNQSLFASSVPGTQVPVLNTKNDAGGDAYDRSHETALAQMAVTGTFNDTYYARAETQLDRIATLAEKVSPEYLARVAIYAAENGRMKDVPAFLLAVLSRRDAKLFHLAFNRVITNGKMLRNFVQFIRSGTTARKSLGTGPRRAIARWLNQASLNQLMHANIGNAPSLKDVIKLTHPKPQAKTHEEFFSYVVRDTAPTFQPLIDYKTFVAKLALYNTAIKEGLPALPPSLPAVPLEMLLPLDMPTSLWFNLAMQMSWTQLRMNLNTLARNGVFEADVPTHFVAKRLGDTGEVRRSKCMPYQIYTAYLHGKDLPVPIQQALERAMEVACENVPTIDREVVLMLDVSQSMRSPITGARKGATSVMSNVQVAALITSALLRQSKKATVMPFDVQSYRIPLDGEKAIVSPHFPIMRNATELVNICRGGGTDVSSPMEVLCDPRNGFEALPEAPVLIMVSDNESWAAAAVGSYHNRRTQMLEQWRHFRKSHPKAKLICIDISPNTTVQVPDEPGVINIGGFSDAIFPLIDDFIHDRNGLSSMADRVNAVNLGE